MAKLWQKDKQLNSSLTERVEQFTAGRDRLLDEMLAPFDVLGSLAHTQMLSEVGLLQKTEAEKIRTELQAIYRDIQTGLFSISEGSEDIHSEIEFRLTEKLGDLGKKVHSGRSRNDQILLDLKLFTRHETELVAGKTKALFDLLIRLARQHQNDLLPGYTHLQLAMPSSFGLWFGAYAESLADDMELLYASFTLANKNPLGSGAGYGGSFPLNRQRTTELLGFADLNYNVVYAQMNRGKMEKAVTGALAAIAATLGRLAMDCCLYMNQNFGFISFPDELTTGSSIMPHKKNPDVWELIRAKCNRLQNLPAQIGGIQANLPSGYHRDMQLIKEDFLGCFDELGDCLDMAVLMLEHIRVTPNILNDDRYTYLFTVEAVNKLVNQGIPFRDAYVTVGKLVEAGAFVKPENLEHTHEGSIGNLCLEAIVKQMGKALGQFPFEHIRSRLNALAE